MKKKFITMAVAAMMLSLGFMSCGDDDDDDDLIPSKDTTTTTPETPKATTQFTVTFLFNGDTVSSIKVDSATALMKANLPEDEIEREVFEYAIGTDDPATAVKCTEDDLDTVIVNRNVTLWIKGVLVVNRPTGEQLRKSNYTAAGKYFDFANMKAYSTDYDDPNKYTYVSDITFNEDLSMIEYEDEYSTYKYYLFFVGDQIYRRTGIYTMPEGEDINSFFGKYVGKDRYGDDVTIEIDETTFYDGEGNEHEWKVDGYKIVVDDFYYYYYNGVDILTLVDYFAATDAPAPTIDATSSK